MEEKLVIRLLSSYLRDSFLLDYVQLFASHCSWQSSEGSKYSE